jgi:putative restriction endonuclease
MDQREQAELLWPLLALAARNRQRLTYSEVFGFTGIIPVGLGKPLGFIHRYCKLQKFPCLNLIVVNTETGQPGDGVPGQGMTPEDVSREQTRVFDFDWSSKDKPRVNDFVERGDRVTLSSGDQVEILETEDG